MAAPLIQTTTQETQFDPFIESTMMNLLGAASNEANKAYTPYKGQRVAALTPDELRAMQTLRDTYLDQQPVLDKAGTALNKGLSTLDTTGGNWDSTVAQQYMNPYIQNVVNATTDEATRNNQKQLSTLRANNVLTGSFGGSRGAVAEAELVGNNSRALNTTLSNLYSQGYDSAYDKFDRDRQAGITKAGAYGQAGAGLSGLAGANTSYTSGQASNLMGIGSTARNINQTNLDTAYSDFTNQRDYNKGQISYLSSILTGQNPQNFATGQTQTITPTYASNDSTLGNITAGLGLASNLANAFGSVFGNSKAKGGLVKIRKYAEGGLTKREADNAQMNAFYNRLYSELEGADPSRLRELVAKAAYYPTAGLYQGIGNVTDSVMSGLENIGEYFMTPRSQRNAQQTELGVGDSVNPTALTQDVGYAPGMVLPEDNIGYSDFPQEVVQNTGTSPNEKTIPVGAQTLGDLYNTEEPSFLDKLTEANPLLMAGLGMIGAGAENNPYDTWASQANAIKDSLTTYNSNKLERDKLNLDRVNAKVTAADNAAKNAITMRGQDITKELGLNSDLVEQIKAAQKAQNDTLQNRLSVQTLLQTGLRNTRDAIDKARTMLIDPTLDVNTRTVIAGKIEELTAQEKELEAQLYEAGRPQSNDFTESTVQFGAQQ